MAKKFRKYKQGQFKPANPSKYKGDPTKIFYRSSWELKFMLNVDKDPTILEWSSEEVIVPYRSPIDNKIHRYFADFVVKKKIGNKITTVMVEIKPEAQSKPPKKPSRQTNKYIREVLTFGVNQAKWEAARQYCNKKGWEFEVLGETALGIR